MVALKAETVPKIWNVGGVVVPVDVRRYPAVEFVIDEIEDPTVSPTRTRFAAMVVAPVPPLGTPRVPPNVIVPLIVIGLFEIVNPVVPPLRPTLVTVPEPGVKLRPIVMGALVPPSVRVTGAAAARTLELGSTVNEELTVMKDMPLAKVLPCPKGSADIAPVVVRLVVPA